MPQQSYIKSLLKTIVILIAIISILLLCIITITFSAFSIWIHTYKAFTQKTLVAEITATEKMTNEGVPYAEVTYKEVDSKTAFERIFYQDETDNTQYKGEQKFTIYGDKLEVSADVVKWNDWGTLIGLDTVYKVTRINGEYLDTEMERTAKRSVFDLNGGTDSLWLFLEKNQKKISFVADSVYTSSASNSFQDEELKWNLYVTEDGFYLDLQ